MKRTFLSLGSNLGDREANLREALRRLESPRLHVKRISPLYETEPIGLTGQPWFLNLVAEAETSLFPMMLLDHTQRVEREMGRKKGALNGPRKIDVDILLYAHLVIETARLQVPHPRMHERRFVLEPMLELAPDLPHPVLRKTMLDLFTGVKGQAARRHP
jgi:2-amino-4-hydroxy-6-hydroxymethyldihydropteridine diphosphokinase